MTPDAVRWMAKAGYAARGAVYLILGGLAVLAALGSGGDTTDPRGALLSLFETGYGGILLAAVGLGLLCYAVWRMVQGVADTDGHGRGMKGAAVRAGLLVSAVTHAALGIWALTAAFGAASGGGGKDGVAAWLMQQPFGRWLVAAVGICIIGAGIAHIAKAMTRGYEKWFIANERKMKVIRPIATIGLIARCIVFLIVGGLFIYAGVTVDPSKAGGVREALQWLRSMPFGSALFLVIAFGLLCFGAYSLTQAFYRRITAGDAVTRAVRRVVR